MGYAYRDSGLEKSGRNQLELIENRRRTQDCWDTSRGRENAKLRQGSSSGHERDARAELFYFDGKRRTVQNHELVRQHGIRTRYVQRRLVG